MAKLTSSGIIQAVKWVTGTKDEFPEIQEFIDQLLKSANHLSGLDEKSSQLDLRFGYTDDDGLYYTLEVYMGSNILYRGTYGHDKPRTQKGIEKVSRKAFEFLSKRMVVDLTAKGLVFEMLHQRVRNIEPI